MTKELKSPTSNEYQGSIYTSTRYLPEDFVQGVMKLERELSMPVWMLIQNEKNSYGFISSKVYKDFFNERNNLPVKKPVALLLHSLGGEPAYAYRLANLFIKHCSEFMVLIPSYAKSAATLLTLGSSRIVLGKYAELGPLDMQVPDEDRETFQSALNQVQALERLWSIF